MDDFAGGKFSGVLKAEIRLQRLKNGEGRKSRLHEQVACCSNLVAEDRRQIRLSFKNVGAGDTYEHSREGAGGDRT